MMIENPIETHVKTRKPSDFQPEPFFPEGHRWARNPRCQAWNRNKASQCQKIPMRGKSVCRSHGGAGGRPPTHGQHSKASKTLEAHLRMLPDPELLDLRPEYAILAARMDELMVRIDSEEGQFAGEDFLNAARLIKKGVVNNDIEMCATGPEMLCEATESGQGEAATWKEIFRTIQLMERLVASVRGSQRANGQAVPIQDVLCILSAVLDIVASDVKETQVRAEIFSRMEDLIGSIVGFWAAEGIAKELDLPGRGIFAGLNLHSTKGPHMRDPRSVAPAK